MIYDENFLGAFLRFKNLIPSCSSIAVNMEGFVLSVSPPGATGANSRRTLKEPVNPVLSSTGLPSTPARTLANHCIETFSFMIDSGVTFIPAHRACGLVSGAFLP
jgi:hypothetical protein